MSPQNDSAAEDSPPTDADAQAAKDKFRAALDRKSGKRHPHESASQAEAKVHDAHGAAGAKRTHRRKSG